LCYCLLHKTPHTQTQTYVLEFFVHLAISSKVNPARRKAPKGDVKLCATPFCRPLGASYIFSGGAMLLASPPITSSIVNTVWETPSNERCSCCRSFLKDMPPLDQQVVESNLVVALKDLIGDTNRRLHRTVSWQQKILHVVVSGFHQEDSCTPVHPCSVPQVPLHSTW
jgi:hypothetical protein